MDVWHQIDYVSRIEENNVYANPLRYTKETARLPREVARVKLTASSKRNAKSKFLDVATDVEEIIRILPLELVINGWVYDYADTKDPEGTQRDIDHYSDKGYKYRKVKNNVGDYHLYVRNLRSEYLKEYKS